jgi:hypothetical protein
MLRSNQDLLLNNNKNIFTPFRANPYNNQNRKYSTKANSVSVLNPILCYSNADLLKETIVENNKGQTGVYRWVNQINGQS